MDLLRIRPCPRWLESLIERALRVSVEIVAHDGDFLAVLVTGIEDGCHFFRPIELGPSFSDRDLPPSNQWLCEKEDACSANSFVFVIHSFWMLPGGRDGAANFIDELHRLFVHAKDRSVGIVGLLIDFENLFHCRSEFGACLGWDHPILDFTGVKPVFLSVLRTVS